MTKITEETYNEFPSLRGKEAIFEEAIKIIVEGWEEAKRQMSQSQKMQEIKQEKDQEKPPQPVTSLPPS